MSARQLHKNVKQESCLSIRSLAEREREKKRGGGVYRGSVYRGFSKQLYQVSFYMCIWTHRHTLWCARLILSNIISQSLVFCVGHSSRERVSYSSCNWRTQSSHLQTHTHTHTRRRTRLLLLRYICVYIWWWLIRETRLFQLGYIERRKLFSFIIYTSFLCGLLIAICNTVHRTATYIMKLKHTAIGN